MSRSTDSGVVQCLQRAIEAGAFPGCTFAYGDAELIELGALGYTTYQADSEVSLSTNYDLASLTKVLYTTLRTLELVREGVLGLDQEVASILPAFHRGVTIRHLLLHNSGLPAHRLYSDIANTPEEARTFILKEPLKRSPGEQTEYSCIGFLVLHFALEALKAPQPVTWSQIEAQFRFSPCTMAAPTEVIGGTPLCGVVHDENARLLGGRAGNAGLFGNVSNVARLAQFWLRNGEGLFAPEMVVEWTSKQADRALGWDVKSEVGSSAGDRFGPRSYGHTGFTGTSLWIDPDAGIFGVLLSNRVYPTRENLKIQQVRPQFYNAVAQALRPH